MDKEWRNVLIFFGVIFLIWIMFTPDSNITGDTIYNQEELEDLRWDHMPVTYKIINEKECGTYEPAKIRRAFLEIEESTDRIVFFEEVDSSPDIEISCSFIEDCYEKTIDVENYGSFYTTYETETICEHDAGYAEITDYSDDKILKAEIEFVGLAGFRETDNKGASGFLVGTCGHLNTELHEVLHVFGYEHTNDENSIMNPYGEGSLYKLREKDDCIGSKKEIDEEIISCLKYTYSNGEVGSCSEELFSYEEEYEYDDYDDCDEGYYDAINDYTSCCQEPGMIVNEEGYCMFK